MMIGMNEQVDMLDVSFRETLLDDIETKIMDLVTTLFVGVIDQNLKNGVIQSEQEGIEMSGRFFMEELQDFYRTKYGFKVQMNMENLEETPTEEGQG